MEYFKKEKKRGECGPALIGELSEIQARDPEFGCDRDIVGTRDSNTFSPFLSFLHPRLASWCHGDRGHDERSANVRSTHAYMYASRADNKPVKQKKRVN